MSKTPPLVVVPSQFTFEVKILLDPRTGQTQMECRNRGLIPVDMLKVVGLLNEHSAHLIKGLIKGEVKVQDNSTEGGTPNAS